MGDVPPRRGQLVEISDDTGCDPRSQSAGRKAATAALGERPAAHQLVGGIKAHQGDDGYPA